MGKAEAAEKAKKVKFVIFDIHGMLTDNTLLLHAGRDEIGGLLPP